MKRMVVLLSILGLSACQTLGKSDRRSAKKTVVKMVNAIDTKNWQRALSQFDETVFVDYQSMTGQPGQKTKAKDLVAGWQGLLTKAKTHHMLTNFEVTASGDTAEVFSHVYASHDAKGVKYWDIYGRYHHKLKKTSNGWKITFMKLIVHGQKGNTSFLSDLSK